MSQHDFNIANQTFSATRTDLNNAFGALATNSAGNSAPSTTYASQWWFDSDGNKLYIRNKDNDNWVEVLTIGATSDKVESIGVDDLTFADNSKLILGTGGDLEIYHDGSNSYIQDNGTGDLKITSNGNAISLQKGTSETLAFFDTDAGVFLYHDNTERLQTNSSGIDVSGSVQIDDGGSLGFGGTNYKIEGSSSANHRIAFHTDGSERGRFDSSGNFALGTTSTSGIRLQAITPTANNIALQVENSNTADSFGMVVKGGNDANDYTADFRKRDNTSIMRILGDGNVFVAKATTAYTTVGHELLASGRAFHTADGGKALSLVRNSSNGAIMDFYNSSGSEVGSIETAASGIGIKLGGTASANLLDDYEEGTWTATLSGTGSSSGQGYDNQTMQYTKIGRVVYLTGMLDMNSLGTLGGDYLKITGLPFTPDSSNSNSYQPITTHHVNVAGDVTGAHFGWTVYASNSFMYVFEHTHGGATQATTSGDYENGTTVGCSGAYITAS